MKSIRVDGRSNASAILVGESIRSIGDHAPLEKAVMITERGERRKLNFGHTFGHAIEKTTGISHGEAVGIGMAIASRLSHKWGYLTLDAVERIEALLTKLGLPVRSHCAPEALLDAMRKDKKRNGGSIHFVLLEAVGQAVVKEMPIHELGDAIRGCALPFEQ